MTRTDRLLLERLLKGLHPLDDIDVSAAVFVEHPGDPISKARARVTEFGSFTPKRTRDAQASLAKTLGFLVPGTPWYSNIAIAMVFYRPDHRVIDEDNLSKLVLDAGTKARLWQDDCQVTRKTALIELDAANPRTVIALMRTTSTLDRTVPMKQRRGPSLPLHQICIASPDGPENR